MRLVPVAPTKVNGPAIPHVIHDVFNVPGLVFVAWRVIWWDALLLVEWNTLVHGLDALLVIVVRILLRVVAEDPAWQLRGRTARINLDLVPVGVLEEFSVGEAELLRASVSDEAVTDRSVRFSVVWRQYQAVTHRNLICARTDCEMLSFPPICRHEAIETASSTACVAPFPDAGR